MNAKDLRVATASTGKAGGLRGGDAAIPGSKTLPTSKTNKMGGLGAGVLRQTGPDTSQRRPADGVDEMPYSDLEAILAIPADGKKLLNKYCSSNAKGPDHSRNSYLKKLAAASTLSIGSNQASK